MRSPFDAMFRWWKPASGASANGAANGNGHQQPGSNGTGSRDVVADAPAVDAPPAEPRWLAQLDREGVPRTLQYPSTTLARPLDQAADRFGESPAMVHNLQRWTFRAL